MADITQGRLKELLHYDRDTGVFTRRVRINNRAQGTAADCKTSHGYVRITLDGTRYLAHRLAWLYEYGLLPTVFIDHINHNPADNRIANLREATMAENKRNANRQRNNTSGHKGVSFNISKGKWEAYVKHNGSLVRAGTFADLRAAVLARESLAKTLHGEFYAEVKAA